MSNPSERGWGPGYPYCQSSKMVPLTVNGVSFGTVRFEVRELLTILLKEAWLRGYRYKDGQCWGYACRAIRGSSAPSVHSWGLAIDINAVTNWMGRQDRGDIPVWLENLFAEFGFDWGGNWESRPDPMHFEFILSPASAERLTTFARQEGLGEDRMTDAEKAAFQELKALVADMHLVHEGVALRLQGRAEPKEVGPKRQGWRQADRFLNEPTVV